MSVLPSPIQHHFKSPSQCIKGKGREEEEKGKGGSKEKHTNQVGKKKKRSLFADDMITYVDNTKEYTKKKNPLISEFSKSQDTKLTKSVTFL